jgi:hypothetical protein
MVSQSNYYQHYPNDRNLSSADRFPTNHVQFATILRPIQWIDKIYAKLGLRAFALNKAMLHEFDSAAPLDRYLGTESELAHNRNLIISLCTGIDENPLLSPTGKFLLKQIALRTLQHRKLVLKYYSTHIDTISANTQSFTPIIITGLPRSGTTLLHRLMSEDPNTRSLYTFEMEVPLPPMTSEADPLKDPRIKNSQSTISMLTRLAPGFIEKFAESHVWSPTEMEESLPYMLGHNGMHVMNFATAGRAYMDALFRFHDKRPVFRYERLFFEMLDAYRPAKSHWTLKAPFYAMYFPLVFEEYPEARVVVTHRNPLIALPSICRLLESWCIAFDQNGSFDKHRFGRFQKRFVEQCLTVPLNYRREHPELADQLFDCMYDELFADPIAMVERIYDTFGLQYTSEFETRMRVYLKNNQQGKYGRHSYSLAEYGFRQESVYDDFVDYMEQYGFDLPGHITRPRSFSFGLDTKAN